MMYGYDPNYNNYYPFHIFGSIFMIMFWVIVFVVLIRIIMRGSGSGHYGHWRGWRDRRWHEEDHSHSIEILKERYAKGEITKETFEQMKKDLM